MPAQIRFSSILGIEYREDLEQLMFFNPLQNKALTGINHAISEYGVPGIVEDNGHLRVSVEGLPESQTLFAFDDASAPPVLAGVMVYMRTDPENLVLLHIAVHQDYSRAGIYGDEMLVWRFMTQLREIARRIKGIRSITLKYSSGLVIPV